MSYSRLLYICSVRTGIPIKFVRLIADTLFEEILLQLTYGKAVKVAKFGTFTIGSRSNSKNAGYIKLKQSRLVKKLFNIVKQYTKE